MIVRSVNGKLTFLLCLSFVITAACMQAPAGASNDSEEPPRSEAGPSSEVRFRVETLAVGLEVPWAFAWLPNKDMLFTERPGRVRIIERGSLRSVPVFTAPDVEPTGESGLMDISLHPSFATNGFVYL